MITSIIIPYRQKNLSEVLNGLKSQTVESKIWIIDNTGTLNKGEYGEDLMISFSKDMGHRPRFPLCNLVTTEHVFIQDDDFAIVNDTLFEQLLELNKTMPDTLIGTKGKTFGDYSSKEKPYQHSTGWVGNGYADMVNTGLSFFRTEILNKLPYNFIMNSEKPITEEDYKYGDDMYISSFLDCHVTDLFESCIKRLDECGLGVSHDSVHMDIRNKLCREYWL